jgi:hypothetical protein
MNVLLSSQSSVAFRTWVPLDTCSAAGEWRPHHSARNAYGAAWGRAECPFASLITVLPKAVWSLSPTISSALTSAGGQITGTKTFQNFTVDSPALQFSLKYSF